MNKQEILSQLPTFTIASAGDLDARFDLTIQAAEQTFPFLLDFMNKSGMNQTAIVNADDYDKTPEAINTAKKLAVLFNQYGSDKAAHNYHPVYGSILKEPEQITHVLEVGLGTNNTDVVSNMGAHGKPCASIRTFRDFLPNAQVFGADIDTRILIEEERIKTFYVDQTNPQTLEDLSNKLDFEFDLIIDDGLHSPNANIATMAFALPKLKKGGYFIIEDLINAHYAVWVVVTTLLKGNYKSTFVSCDNGILLVIQKL